MPKLLLPPVVRVLAAFALSLGAVPAGRAQTIPTVTTLHSFDADTDGFEPVGTLIIGKDGSFYGTASGSGPGHLGTVYKLTTDGKFTVLHSFAAGQDGATPTGALVQAADGALWGTTFGYVALDIDPNADYPGTVYRLAPNGSLVTLYRSYGSLNGGLAQGPDGSFYGASSYGDNSYGKVFKITADGQFITIHDFTDGDDGGQPHDTSTLVLASDGNLYGTAAGFNYTTSKVALNNGTIYRVTPGGVFTTVYRFTGGRDGVYPATTLIQGRDGRLYGTTWGGQQVIGNPPYPLFHGTIFSVALDGSGFKTLHTFTSDDIGGTAQANTLVQAADGNFYGTTTYRGANGAGTLFQLTPDGVFTTLYNFAGRPEEGGSPIAALIQSPDGSLYGTASRGGAHAGGTVFKVTFGPPPSPFFADEVPVGSGAYYLSFAGGNSFGYYAFLSDPHYLYHFDLGYEYVFDAADGKNGVYLYDFKSGSFFYTSPTFPFPYLYDFTLNTVLYYYPDPSNVDRYNTNGVRYFYNFATGKIITK